MSGRPLRAPAAGIAVACAVGWNIANVGAVAEPLAGAYGVALATIGLLTTALFVCHLLMQIPAGKGIDRFGARRASFVALVTIVAANLLALVAPHLALGLAARALAGIGTGIGFVAGSDYVRATGGTPFLQGLYGGAGIAGGGLALAVVPQLDGALGWRAPFLTAIALALATVVLLLAAPSDRSAGRSHGDAIARGVLGDRRLYRLALMHAASLGLSVVAGNWVVTLLERGGHGRGVAGLLGSLTLVLGVVTRPLGGWLTRRHPERARAALAASIAAGSLGTLVLASSAPLAVLGVASAVVGLAAGVPFATSFSGAQRLRPDAPAAAIGFVNGTATLVIVVGTPLVGLAFSLPGDGRIGFAALAALWATALLALPSPDELGTASGRS